ncbi:hypothetical protein PR003_g7251 [Phytophthora rubi]|uniref:Uncharacterized protein n=1 Tax=Phytophthora rubi TaxID=129364 RepID=A0A6A3N5Q8_9STRA|nr:hypothetical protein PR002_g7154 [Phytophthora rubi]KAE9346807.1 hypothetical protein PR003_g7251 [Phytophthora rubi]
MPPPLATTLHILVRALPASTKTVLSCSALPQTPPKAQLLVVQKRPQRALRQLRALQRSAHPQPTPPRIPVATLANFQFRGFICDVSILTFSGHDSSFHSSRVDRSDVSNTIVKPGELATEELVDFACLGDRGRGVLGDFGVAFL